MHEPPKKVAVITGGSEGLGLALAHELGQRRLEVWLLARDPSKLTAAIAELREKNISAHAIPTDITDAEAVEAAARQIQVERGAVHWLVSCAGGIHPGTLASLSREDCLADLDVNLKGPVLLVKSFGPLLEPGGTLLFISSGFGLMGPAGYATYSAAKAGVLTFAEAMRREYHARKIRVFAAVPTDIQTPGLARELAALPEWLRISAARGQAAPAQVIARKILARCCGSRFLIFTDTAVRSLALVTAWLPRSIRDWGIDRLFPKPPRHES